MSKKIRVQMKKGQSKVAYIKLPGYPKKLLPGVTCKTIGLEEIVSDYDGPTVNLDFNKDGTLIGIEILVMGE